MATSRRTRSGIFSGSISKKRNTGQKVAPGEEEFLKLIELAEKEINIDPYRGIRLLLSHYRNHEHQTSPTSPLEIEEMSGTKITPIKNEIDDDCNQQCYRLNVQGKLGPWHSNCSMRHTVQNAPIATELQHSQTSTDSTDTGEIISVADSIEEQMQSTIGCACPTLMKWMSCARQRNEKRIAKRKRKRNAGSYELLSGCVGRRCSDDVDKECVCDYNPFCVMTLGGAMDDMLEHWINGPMNTNASPCEEDTEDDVIVIDDTTAVVDISIDHHSNDALDFFKPKTLELLKQVRKCTFVSETSIRLYLRKILPGLTDALSIDDGIDYIRTLQKELVFTNPVLVHEFSEKTATTDVDKEIRLAMPPGIENLGATCYLNTQLQCLAQNLVFVDGILSWKPSTNGGDDRMTSVLALFQDLLQRMNSGPHAIVNTLEFSNALGLDHFEQQDPNEFSRLFFDRMHDSFQGGDDNKNLADLLPRLFQGVLAYEITCLVCGTKSKRTEEFMDLNLPIVQRKVIDFGENKKNDSLQSKLDTDVQHCLNEYCSDEMLDGENQYHCSNCNGKCDAKRSVSFQTLPPVLNVQLCRYVFNREKLIKTKLSDKVLLPLHLDVQSLNGGTGNESTKSKYYLCAIMRHKGTSAYSGHYVAETMDWRSGQWFEFNDAAVTHLKNGPSNCYDPNTLDLQFEELGMTNRSKSSHLVGSTDAYNMYYVEESFLAHCILEKMRKQLDLLDMLPLSTTLMSKERSTYFDELHQLCLDDEGVANQLKKRRELLCSNVLPTLTFLNATDPKDLVWIETSFLRQFLSCKDVFTAQLEQHKAFQSHRDLLCTHKNPALHPRIARSGKLIPKDAYDSLMEIIDGEINGTVESGIANPIKRDVVISLPSNLVCEYCMQEYKSELDGKVSFVSSVKYLYDELDPKELKSPRPLQPGEKIEDENDQYKYIVSRKFVTWFRNKTMRFMKQAINARGETKIQSDTQAISTKSNAMGLDGLNIEEFWNLEDNVVSFGTVNTCGVGEDEGIAIRVNGPLTCRHGNFIANASGNSFVYVSWHVWKYIRAMFPLAIAHKRRRLTISLELENSSDDDDDFFGCMLCNDEEISKNCLKRNLDDFAKRCQTSQQNKVLPLDNSALQTLSADMTRFYLVSADDFDAWNKALKVLSRNNKGKGDQTYKQLVESVLLRRSLENHQQFSWVDTNNCGSNGDRKILEQFSLFFRSTFCDVHGLHVCDALFRNFDSTQGEGPLALRDNIYIVPEEEYHQFLSHVGAASVMLCRSENESNWTELSVDEMISQGRKFLDRTKVAIHNYCVAAPNVPDDSAIDRFFVNNKLFQLSEQSCKNEICRQAYKSQEPTDCREAQEVSGSVRCGGFIDDTIDCDVEIKAGPSTPPTVSLTVLDVRSNAELSSVLTMLESVNGLSNRDAQEIDPFFVRRSSRKRTSRYTCGDVLDEETLEIHIDNNVAALRLALMERCTKGTEFELNHNLKLVFLMRFKTDDKENNIASISLVDSEPLFKMIDLPFSSNTKTIRDIFDEGFGGPFDLSIATILIRQASTEPSTEKIPRDELLDTLLSLANTPTCAKSDGAKPRKSRTEKGFSGTFLSQVATATKEASISTEMNGVATSPTAILPNLNGDNSCSKKIQNEPVVNSDIEDLTGQEEASTCHIVDLHDELGEATKPVAVDSKKQCPSNTSNDLCSSTIICDVEISDECSPRKKGGIAGSTTKPGHSEIKKDNSIIVDDSDNDNELLHQSPFKKRSINVSPSRTFSTKRIQLSLDSLVKCASKNTKHTDEAWNNGTHRQNLRIDGPDPKLASEIVQILLANPDITKEKTNIEMCRMAAESAVAQHPHIHVALDLAEPAYAFYLELMFP